MASYWEYKTVPVFLVNFLASYLIYNEQCFRPKVIKSTVSMLLIFYCGLMGGKCFLGHMGFLDAVPLVATGGEIPVLLVIGFHRASQAQCFCFHFSIDLNESAPCLSGPL